MARIAYSCAGEGRGHATRVRTLTDLLRDRHEITILAPRDAFALLSPAYLGSDVRVLRLPGLFFHYGRRGQLHYPRTALGALRYLAGLPALVEDLAQFLVSERFDLVLTDFDPGLPRAARRAGVPYLSVDHQSFLRVSDLSALPGDLRRHARFMEWIVRAYYDRPVHRVSSSFYRPPLRPGLSGVTQVGCLLRPALLALEPTHGDHLAAYFRRPLAPNVTAALARSPHPVRLYGLGEQPSEGSLSYHPISETGFLADLASCRALVTTAGNQLVGEAHYLGKPVLAIPEPGNQEQRINAWFLEQAGGGEAADHRTFSPQTLTAFLTRAESHANRIDRSFACGNDATVQAVEAILAARPQSAHPIRPSRNR